MDYKFDVKNVSSLVALTHLEKRTFVDLESTCYELYRAAEATGAESIFCIIEKPTITDDLDVKVYCPINSVDLAFHEKKYKIEVLPRALVLSTVHLGEYNDLKPAFENLFEYINKNNLTTSIQYRVIFHREKRVWDRKKLHHKPETEYVSEVQIQIFDK